MKHLLTFLLVACSITADAQCLLTDLGLSSPTYMMRVFDAELTDGGMIVGLKEQGTFPWNAKRDVLLYRADAAGNVTWSRRFVPVNPSIRLGALGVMETPDGGVLVHGNYSAASNSPFALKLDTQGRVEWARGYMLNDSLVGHNDQSILTGSTGMGPLTEGGYLYSSMWWGDMYYRIHLDPSGVPVDARAYPNTSAEPLKGYGTTVVEADGGLFSTQWAVPDTAGFGMNIIHLDPIGEVAWWTTISPPSGNSFNGIPTIARAFNGDLFVTGSLNGSLGSGVFLGRVQGDGQLLWLRKYDPLTLGFPWDIDEFSNGEILVSLGGNTEGGILHTSPNGTPLAVGGTLMGGPRSIAIHNDSILAHRSTYGGNSYYPYGEPGHVLLAPNVSALMACATPMPLPQHSLVPCSQFDVPPALYFPEIKSWPLAIMESDLNSCDVLGILSGSAPRLGGYFNLWGSVENAAGLSSGPLEVSITLPPEISPNIVSPTPTLITGNTVLWSGVQALNGFDEVDGGFQISGTVVADTALIGDPITTTITVTQDSTESNVANNTFSFTQTLLSSYDPNDKIVRTSSGFNDAEFYPGIDEWLDYTIRFQNTGNDTAFTVVITDTLPSELSTTTLSHIAASHPYTYAFGGEGILRFTFENILLPDSTTNVALSQGMVSFRIKPDDGLPIGTVIANNADIFFDFNPPVRTADATVTITMSNGIPELDGDHLLIYPVPVREVLIAQLPDGFRVESAEIHALDGRLVVAQNMQALSGRLDLEVYSIASGVYLLSVQGTSGQKLSARFMKE